MKAKREIEEILKEKFDNFEPQIPESVWTGIESNIGSGAGASGGLLSTLTGKIAAILVAGGLITGSVYVINNYQVTPKDANEGSMEESSQPPSSSTETNSVNQHPENTTTTPITESKVVSVETSKGWTEIKEPVEVRVKTITRKDEDRKAPVYPSVADMHMSQSSRTIITLQDLEKMSQTSDELQNENLSTENITVVVEKPEEDGAPFATIDASVVGGKAPLEVKFSQYSSEGKIKWVFGDGTISSQESPGHIYTEPGRYVVSLIIESDNGEIAIDEKVIEVSEAIENTTNEQLPVSQINSKPNVFTPNGDGINDYMMVGAENMEIFHFILMDLNSNDIIFETHDPAFKWDGMLTNGQKIELGTYVYLIRAKGKDGNIYDTSGTLSVQ